MIAAQTLRVCREGKPLHAFPDHALSPQLDQVPAIPIEVIEDRNDPIRLLTRLFAEPDASGSIGLIVAPEIVGVQKQEYAAAGLIPDPSQLLRGYGLCQQEPGFDRPRRSDQYPALAATEVGV